ncbi:accessory factor UbiK family protein [Robiginitomaculum antarcticum]|uniref:accessory factor UbiK family protein n=1 Tax=Robiginitomaculum antarcticum TaxID=437507 RepID=UPI00037E966B|nr:accessory factor UbiK family protein [Robiginitomaculum antarcticum]
MQSKSTVVDDISNLFTNAVGAAKGVGDEIKAASRARLDGIVADMDLVGREEFDVLKEMVSNLTVENEKMAKTISSLKRDITKLKKG